MRAGREFDECKETLNKPSHRRKPVSSACIVLHGLFDWS